jgi:superfamily I DNA and/or RNA helicase
MHEQIMDFSSRQFYGGALSADDSVRGHRLCDLPGVRSEQLTEEPVLFIDTAGASYDEEQEPEGESKLNPQEAGLAALKVRALLEAGVAARDIAVIAPYSAQVRRLRRELGEVAGLEIDSVDGFQGREKEAVVISLVRSNSEGEIGFLADVRRMNVALTRARRKLVVIGDSATLSVLPFYQQMFEYFEAIGAYHTVWEEP